MRTSDSKQVVKVIGQQTASPSHADTSSYTLQWAAPPLLKIVPSRGRSVLPSNTQFLGPTRVHIPNGISIGSASFAGLTIMIHK